MAGSQHGCGEDGKPSATVGSHPNHDDDDDYDDGDGDDNANNDDDGNFDDDDFYKFQE